MGLAVIAAENVLDHHFRDLKKNQATYHRLGTVSRTETVDLRLNESIDEMELQLGIVSRVRHSRQSALYSQWLIRLRSERLTDPAYPEDTQ